MAGEGLRAHRRDQDHADQPQRDPQRGLSRPLGPGRDLRPPALRTGRLCCGGGAADLRGRARRPAQLQAGAGSGGAGAALYGLRAALRAAAGSPGEMEGGLRADAPEPALSLCGVPRGSAGDGGVRAECAVHGWARADRGPHRHRQDGGGALRRAEGAGRREGNQRVLSHRAHHGPPRSGECAELDARRWFAHSLGDADRQGEDLLSAQAGLRAVPLRRRLLRAPPGGAAAGHGDGGAGRRGHLRAGAGV